MIFHSLLFLTVILFYVLLCHEKNNGKNELLFLRIIFIVFSVLVATREMTVGSDTPMYLRLFKECADKKWSIVQFGGYFEPGYLALNVLISYISSSPRFFMVVMSLLINYGFYRFIKKYSKQYLISVVVFMGLSYLYTSMTMMRQLIAMIIVLYGFRFLLNKKIIKFAITVAVASLFHSSAWVALTLFPLMSIKYNKKKALIVMAIGILASLSIGLLSNRYMEIIGRNNFYEDRIGGYNFGNILSALIFFALFVISRVVLGRNKTVINFSREDSRDLFVLLGTSAISIAGLQMDIISRVVCYFNILSIISIPYFYSCYMKSRSSSLYALFIVLLFFSYSSAAIVFRPEWNTAYDYKSCLLKGDNYVCE